MLAIGFRDLDRLQFLSKILAKDLHGPSGTAATVYKAWSTNGVSEFSGAVSMPLAAACYKAWSTLFQFLGKGGLGLLAIRYLAKGIAKVFEVLLAAIKVQSSLVYSGLGQARSVVRTTFVKNGGVRCLVKCPEDLLVAGQRGQSGQRARSIFGGLSQAWSVKGLFIIKYGGSQYPATAFYSLRAVGVRDLNRPQYLVFIIKYGGSQFPAKAFYGLPASGVRDLNRFQYLGPHQGLPRPERHRRELRQDLEP